jgi:hypothetical protein
MVTGTDPAARLAAHLVACLGADSAWVPALRSLAAGQASLHLALLTEPFLSLTARRLRRRDPLGQFAHHVQGPVVRRAFGWFLVVFGLVFTIYRIAAQWAEPSTVRRVTRWRTGRAARAPSLLH